MEAQFGWTLLSRDALRRAETQLRDEIQGVRDEIGFLALHQAYADRFFPGTSVLHTRLRYVLFVPWMYQRLAKQPNRSRVAAAVEKQELELTRRLKASGEQGVIGGRSYPNPTAQPPSMIYWSALSAWQILRPLPAGTAPSRQAVHRSLARRSPRQSLHDDEHQLLAETDPVFATLPEPPKKWADTTQPLDFQLTLKERKFVRNSFLSVSRPGSDGHPALLSRLAEQEISFHRRDSLWSLKVQKAADKADREALIRARQAAALSAVGRGVYAAMVETMRSDDGLPTDDVHRSGLWEVCDEFRADALALSVDDIPVDAPNVPNGILEVLRQTQQWLKANDSELSPLYAIYEREESRRKDRRARLTRSLNGREKRSEWLPEETAPAQPLHYRWNQVRQLLIDLGGEG